MKTSAASTALKRGGRKEKHRKVRQKEEECRGKWKVQGEGLLDEDDGL